jgi:hypothetical protein
MLLAVIIRRYKRIRLYITVFAVVISFAYFFFFFFVFFAELLFLLLVTLGLIQLVLIAVHTYREKENLLGALIILIRLRHDWETYFSKFQPNLKWYSKIQ